MPSNPKGMAWPALVTFEHEHVRLEPLTPAHHEDLVAATRDGELWNLSYTAVPNAAEMAAEIARRLALRDSSSMLPFAVVERRTNAAVGMTTYMNIDAQSRRLEIGSTWYRKSVQRTAVNTECKLLLLTHAFETLQCIAVEFRTSALNATSRHAIERLGAKLDGVIRSDKRHVDGSLRDTCVYTIIAAEWPVVRAGLEARLGQYALSNGKSTHELMEQTGRRVRDWKEARSRRLDHVQIAIPRGGEDVARKFYIDFLGFEEIPKPAELVVRGGAWFRSGTITLHLGIEDAFTPATKAHPAFRCDGYAALLEQCRAHGIAVVPDPLPFEGRPHCYVADPFGNRLELIG